ncbi:MAG: PadR family transcriptional regulator [Micropruina sp.]|nr:PadR family transcriptional regulator [Micropruina sp.]
MGSFILGLLLALGPQTLYSLNRQFQAGPSLFYSASFGGLQSALRGLVAAGQVTVQEVTESGRHKRIHAITDEGVAAFHAWIRSPLDGDLEVAALARLFHLGLIEEPADRRAILSGIIGAIEGQLADLEGLSGVLAAQTQAVPPEVRDVVRYQLATLDYGVTAHRAGLAWFRALADAEA